MPVPDPNPLRRPTRRSTLPVIVVYYHPTATDCNRALGAVLKSNEFASNMVLPYVLEEQAAEGNGSKACTAEESSLWWAEQLSPSVAGEEGDVYDQSSPRHSPHKSYFMSVWTIGGGERTLDFALACVGVKPVFLFSSKPSSQLSRPYVEPRVHALARRIVDVIPVQRVFSIFGPTPLTVSLSIVWEELTQHSVHCKPFYHAKYTFCTNDTFDKSILHQPLPPNHRICLADKSHVDKAAILCRDFAVDSIFFPETLEQAKIEAVHLVGKGQLWVYEIQLEDGSVEVAAIVAVTRETWNVAAISKVYTVEDMRGRGFARRCVAAACNEVLKRRSKVVLYVAHDNEQAAQVYGRVGFVGVGSRPPHPDVEDWIELGFDNTARGHW